MCRQQSAGQNHNIKIAAAIAKVPCATPWRHMGGLETRCHYFYPSALDGRRLAIFTPLSLCSLNGAFGTHWIRPGL